MKLTRCPHCGHSPLPKPWIGVSQVRCGGCGALITVDEVEAKRKAKERAK
jgi:DNA-directed RNA polymerase subunit RPC12/RpoP